MGEEKRKKGAEAEALGAQRCCLCREHLLSTYYMRGAEGERWGGRGAARPLDAQNSVPAMEEPSASKL